MQVTLAELEDEYSEFVDRIIAEVNADWIRQPVLEGGRRQTLRYVLTHLREQRVQAPVGSAVVKNLVYRAARAVAFLLRRRHQQGLV